MKWLGNLIFTTTTAAAAAASPCIRRYPLSGLVKLQRRKQPVLLLQPTSYNLQTGALVQKTNSSRESNARSGKKASLVIFDKDGTLICFHSMWVPWAKNIAKKLVKATGLDLKDKVYEVLGLCTLTNRIQPGLLAEATNAIIQEELAELLVKEGFDSSHAQQIVDESWEEGNTSNSKTLRSLTDLQALFRILKKNDVKVAICTTDSRKGTENLLRELQLKENVDMVICGDDSYSQPKPSPHNALLICNKLGVEPSHAVMVGDTKVDVRMGKAANLGLSIGVLSGVGDKQDLQPHADHVISSVKDLFPLILPPDQWKDCYVYSADERMLVERRAGEETVARDEKLKAQKLSLAIFDLHGTLVCSQAMWFAWTKQIAKRLEELTYLKLMNKVFDCLGICKISLKMKRGVLAEGSKTEIKNALVQMLRQEGLCYEEAVMTANQAWKDCGPALKGELKSLGDLQFLFKQLRQNNIKIAIDTSDGRQETFDTLVKFGLQKYIDMMVCGDDAGAIANNTLLICSELKSDPSETIVVSDNAKDLTKGREARVKASIGVLSGVGSQADLAPHADHIFPSAWHLLDYMIDRHQNRKFASQRSPLLGNL